MRKFLMMLLASISVIGADAQMFKKPVLTGMYLQWGYNRDKFSKSTIHFHGDNYDFKLHDVVADDKPDFQAFRDKPLDITIPQNSFRIGFYLNAEHTHAIEINFDHAKYVMRSKQTARLTGQIDGQTYDLDTIIQPYFVSFEHTNGANFYHINYVGQHEILRNKKRQLATVIWKAGAGVVIPKSEVVIMGKRLDNKFHVAGYVMGVEAGARFYPLKKFFLEATVKGGYANYLNSLTVESGTAKHAFRYGEVIGLIGYDINFKRKKAISAPETVN